MKRITDDGAGGLARLELFTMERGDIPRKRRRAMGEGPVYCLWRTPDHGPTTVNYTQDRDEALRWYQVD